MLGNRKQKQVCCKNCYNDEYNHKTEKRRRNRKSEKVSVEKDILSEIEGIKNALQFCYW